MHGLRTSSLCSSLPWPLAERTHGARVQRIFQRPALNIVHQTLQTRPKRARKHIAVARRSTLGNFPLSMRDTLVARRTFPARHTSSATSMLTSLCATRRQVAAHTDSPHTFVLFSSGALEARRRVKETEAHFRARLFTASEVMAQRDPARSHARDSAAPRATNYTTRREGEDSAYMQTSGYGSIAQGCPTRRNNTVLYGGASGHACEWSASGRLVRARVRFSWASTSRPRGAGAFLAHMQDGQIT